MSDVANAAKKVAILQSNYIPWKGYFDIINAVDEFIFYDEMQYTKNDWRNRNKIKGAQGIQWLTLAVRQHSLAQKINETEVFDTKWNIKHWRTLAQTYAKAPFFRHYKDELEQLYLDLTTPLLSEINATLIGFVCRQLGITTKLSWSTDYTLAEGKTERLVQLVLDAGGTEYVSGPAARDYVQADLFEQAGLKLSWIDYSGYPEYKQLGPLPFEHGVSILDVLFNTGPDATTFLKTFAPKGALTNLSA